jgi:putative transposase
VPDVESRSSHSRSRTPGLSQRLDAAGPSHLWTALAYAERNPLRARIVRRAEDYVWSSAIAHVTNGDGSGLPDMEWGRSAGRTDWRAVLNRRVEDDKEQSEQHELRACTYAERPFGDEAFVHETAHQIGCHWKRGRPSKKSTLTPHEQAPQFSLFRSPSPPK